MATEIIYKKNYVKLCNQACISGTNLFWPMDNHGKVPLEGDFATFHRWIFIVKYSGVLFLPYTPTHNYDNFHSKRNPSNLLICLVARPGFNHVGTITPIWFQQFLGKAHLRNR
jgi:hypothetical protein